jgi:hypothetical protein
MAMGMLTIRHAFAALAVRHKENVNRILLAQAKPACAPLRGLGYDVFLTRSQAQVKESFHPLYQQQVDNHHASQD